MKYTTFPLLFGKFGKIVFFRNFEHWYNFTKGILSKSSISYFQVTSWKENQIIRESQR